MKIENIRWLILDEADEMLNMGFRDDLDAILENTPESKQTLLFSATMPNGVRRIANNYMTDPLEISAGKKNTGAANVSHSYYVVKASNRYLALKRLVDLHPQIYGIVFCRTREEVKTVAGKLMDDGYSADAIHGDLSQQQRDNVMQRFRTKQIQLLVATDVAARGIDVNNLTHVLNYNLPDDPEVYIHRSGRTGRAGNSGESIIISHSREGSKIKTLEKLTGKNFEHKKIPTGSEVCEKRLFNFMDKVQSIEVDEKQIDKYLPAIQEKMENFDRDELLKRFVSIEFNRFLEYYKGSGDLNVAKEKSDDRNVKSRRKKKDKNNRERNDSENYSRFFINVGSKHNLKVPNLIGLINENTRNKSIDIGKIDIQRNFSFFDIEKDHEQLVLDSFRGGSFGSIKLNVDLSNTPGGGSHHSDPYKGKDKRKKKRQRR